MKHNYIQDENGSRYLPDVVVHLPEGKDIIIDSKVSLKHWEQYCSSDDESSKSALISAHIQSMRTHLKDLSEKSYDQLEGVSSLDFFVLMFIPVETAFVAALENSPELFSDAFNKGIVMVTPSTLFITRELSRIFGDMKLRMRMPKRLRIKQASCMTNLLDL